MRDELYALLPHGESFRVFDTIEFSASQQGRLVATLLPVFPGSSIVNHEDGVAKVPTTAIVELLAQLSGLNSTKESSSDDGAQAVAMLKVDSFVAEVASVDANVILTVEATLHPQFNGIALVEGLLRANGEIVSQAAVTTLRARSAKEGK
jgi:3-hydroxymyristoyl/3-hydroxydecanoyl-(acyl carrier protein) dehydratase